MNIKPKIRGFICATAHPAGCAKAVDEQINFEKSKGSFTGPKNVLVIGASTGYGLASWIVSTFGAGAKSIGVFFERAADEKRTASPGWYNVAQLEKAAKLDGCFVASINGDAFSDEVKAQTAEIIRRELKQVDLIIYSVAAPRRVDPVTGQVYQSVLKPIGQTFKSKTVDVFRGEVKEIAIESAIEDDVTNTVAVMGGDDWERWIDYLAKENLLASGIKTVNYSYIGPLLTHPIYKNGTIGQAKAHAKKTADKLNQKLKVLQGEAIISVNKAVVTQASAAIPVVPLYISLLFKLMKANGTHEDCIQQIDRLFRNNLYGDLQTERDSEGYIRLDDLEMAPDVQAQIEALWPEVTTETLMALTDLEGYRNAFYRLFGFELEGVDYNQEVNPSVAIPSLENPA